jgi:hypothetical protein
VAYIAQEHGAEVSSLGTIGTRQGDIDHRIRKRPSKAKSLVFIYEAGPCGYWLSRDLTQKGQVCWVVAPALMPQKSGRPRDNRPSGRGATGAADALGGSPPGVCPHGRGRRDARSPPRPRRGPAGPHVRHVSSQSLPTEAGYPVYGPGHLGPGPSAVALRSGLCHPSATARLPRIRPGGP